MSNTVFTNKQGHLKKSGWGKKSVIGGIAVALLAGFGFGMYRAADGDASSQPTTRSSHVSHQQSNSLPIFSSLPTMAKSGFDRPVAIKKSKGSSHRHLGGKARKSHKKYASHHHKHHGKHHGKHHALASKKSHHGHGKLKLAKHKKKHSHHLAKTKKSKRHTKHLAAK